MSAAEDAPTEEESPRSGLFSYAGEWHAFIIGLGVGVFAIYAGRPELLGVLAGAALFGRGFEKLNRVLKGRFAAHEVKREPWYALGGAAIGAAVFAVLKGVGLSGMLPF